MAYKFFDKKASDIRGNKFAGGAVKNENVSNQELHKPIIRKFKKWKVYSSFIDNIWGADFAICN